MNNKTKKISLLISWLFLLGSLSLLFYTYYRSEIAHQGHHQEIYRKYYFITISGALFWSLVIKLKEVTRVKILMASVSLLIGIYMVEFATMFLTNSKHPKAVLAKRIGKPFDTRTRSEFIQDLTENGINAIPCFAPSKFARINHQLGRSSICPIGGISNKSTVGFNETGKYMVINSDRYGFNNPDSAWDAKKIDWMLTGDSFAFGQAVQKGEDIASRIRSLTNEYAISLGNNGNGPLIELAALIEYGPTYKPRNMVWLYYEGNDLISDLEIEKEIPTFMNYLKDDFSQQLILRQEEIDNELNKFITENKQSSGIGQYQSDRSFLNKTQFLRLYNLRRLLKEKYSKSNVKIDPLFTQILTIAKKHTESWGGKFYFVYLPDFHRYSSNVRNHDALYKKIEVLNLVESLRIPVIDIHKLVFSKESDPLTLFPWREAFGHYNPLGYKKVAETIIKSVKSF